jgi:acyl-CoA thioesterase
MKNNNIPRKVVDEMMRNDLFSQWLGIDIQDIKEGYCALKMQVRTEMLNGFGIAHGGICFSLADSALAFASNSRNKKSLVLDASLSFIKPVKSGDELSAVAEEVNVTRRTGIYSVTVKNQDSDLVASFKGIVFRKDEEWFPEGD